MNLSTNYLDICSNDMLLDVNFQPQPSVSNFLNVKEPTHVNLNASESTHVNDILKKEIIQYQHLASRSRKRKNRRKSAAIDQAIMKQANAVSSPEQLASLLKQKNLREKRLARKAELARISRRKKKQRLEELEVENKGLRAEIELLRQQRQQDMLLVTNQAHKIQELTSMQHLQPVRSTMSPLALDDGFFLNMKSKPQREADFVDDLICFDDVCKPDLETSPVSPNSDCPNTPTMSSPILSPNSSSEDELKEPVSPQFAIQAVFGVLQKQLQLIEASSARLAKTCDPLTVNFLKWLFNQQPRFYEDQRGPWQTLFRDELHCSPSQMLQLGKVRGFAQIAQSNEGQVQKFMQRMTMSLNLHLATSQANLEQLRSILSQEQLTSLFAWIHRFGKQLNKVSPTDTLMA